MNVKQRQFNEALHKLKNRPKRLLYEAVRKEKAKEADTINHAGSKAQLTYLSDRLGLPGALKLIEQAEADQKELHDLAYEFGQKGMLVDVLQLVAFYKQAEADSVSVEGVELQLKYLLNQLGGRDRLTQCLKERRERESR